MSLRLLWWPPTEHQYVLIYICCVFTHVCCWLFSVRNKVTTTTTQVAGDIIHCVWMHSMHKICCIFNQHGVCWCLPQIKTDVKSVFHVLRGFVQELYHWRLQLMFRNILVWRTEAVPICDKIPTLIVKMIMIVMIMKIMKMIIIITTTITTTMIIIIIIMIMIMMMIMIYI